MSAWTRGGCGGFLAGSIFSVLAILGAGPASAGMYGAFLVAPAVFVLSIPLGALLGLVIGRLRRRRKKSRFLAGLIGLSLGAVVGLVTDLAVHGEINLQDSLLPLTAWIGAWAGAFAGAPIWSRRMRQYAGWQPRSSRSHPPKDVVVEGSEDPG